MLAVIASAAFVCAGALLIGQLALWLCGARSWSWLAPAVGLSGLMLICIPALHTPGRATTTFALVVIGALAGAVLMVRDPAHRPPLAGLAGGVVPALLTLIPFLSAGRVGILGVSFNNDMTSHLSLANSYRSAELARTYAIDPSYPLGPHSVVASIAQGFGIGVEPAFVGLTLALPILIALAAQGVLTRAGIFGRVLTGTLVSMSFILAGYYGQGSFKELGESLFVLTAAIAIVRRDDFTGILRWAPMALMLAGAVSLYSYAGLVWPFVFLGLWLAALLVSALVRRRPVREIAGVVRAEVPAVALGAAIFVVALVPQLPRIWKFLSDNLSPEGLREGGNLAGRIPVWHAFGAWDNPDYRLPPIDAFATGMWTALFLAIVVAGAAWALSRREWVYPLAALAAFLTWVASDRTQAEYYAAKGLVMLAPLLFVLIARLLVESDWPRPRWWAFAVVPLTLVIVLKTLDASTDALRYSKVGDQAHANELRSLMPTLAGGSTVFLGNDDFIHWELPGIPLRATMIGNPDLPTRPEKRWVYGEPSDFDTLDTETLNGFRWVITTREPVGSASPPGMRLVRQTPSFALYERTRKLPQIRLLPEGKEAAAKLDCRSPDGRALVRAGGTAVVREPSVTVKVEPVAPGATRDVVLPKLRAGTWDLTTPYNSEHAVDFTAPGLEVQLPANLDRPGPRYLVGRFRVDQPGDVPVRIHVTKTRLTPPSALGYVNELIATPAVPPREMPVRRACGLLVDHVIPAS